MKVLYNKRSNMRDKITNRLLEIAKNKIGKEVENVNDELLGNKVNFRPVELAIYLKELEQEFNICFKQEDIIRGTFNNIHNISILVEKELKADSA